MASPGGRHTSPPASSPWTWRSFCDYRLTEEADERCAEVNAEEVPQLGLLGCVRVKCDGRPTSKVRI
jgi:hypothetical protein